MKMMNTRSAGSYAAPFTNWDDMIDWLWGEGYHADSIFTGPHATHDQWIYAYDQNGDEYEIEVEQYSDGQFDIIGIGRTGRGGFDGRSAQVDDEFDEYDYIDLSAQARQYAYEQWSLSQEASWWADDTVDEDLQSAEFFFDSIGCKVKDYEIDHLAGPSFYYVDMRDSTYWGLDCTDGDLVEIPEGLSDGLWMAEGLLYKWQTEYRPQLVSLAMEAFQHANGGTATDEDMESYYDELIYRYEKFVSELADMTANDIGESRAWYYSEEAFEDIAMGNDFKFYSDGTRVASRKEI